MLTGQDDKHPVTTLTQWLSDQERLEQEALEQYPFRADACSGGPLYQRAYTCLTCREEKSGLLPDVAMFVCCYACHLQCHPEGHKLVEIGPRRDFTCKCGPACKLPKISPIVNQVQTRAKKSKKQYNSPHNFDGTFCTCRKFDPDATDDPVDVETEVDEAPPTMFQCLACEDWFHGKCIKGMPEDLDSFVDFVCEAHQGDSWVSHYRLWNVVNSKALFLQEGWRDTRCKCPRCANSEPAWVKEAPTLYEPPMEESESTSLYELGLQAINNKVAPHLMSKGLKGMTELKDALVSWLAEHEDQVVTKAEIQTFFADFTGKRQ